MKPKVLGIIVAVLCVAGCARQTVDSGLSSQAESAQAPTASRFAQSAGSDLPPFNFGINLDDPTPFEGEFDRVVESHSGWVRLWAWWNWMETQPGTYNWGTFDAEVAWARKRGLRILATFAWIPAWANGADPNCPFWSGGCQTPPHGTSYADFVSAVVSRYRDDIKYWEIWNEPNLPTFWSASLDEFINDIFRPGIQAVKSIDPTAKIVGPVLSNANPPWYYQIDPFYNAATDYPPDWRYWLDGILKSDVGRQIDVISHHSYENRAGDVISDMTAVHKRAASDGFSNTPIWLTETAFAGCNGSTQTQQWIEVINTITLGMKKNSWWNGTFYFQISDQLPDETGSGQCKSLTSPRPALTPHMALTALPALLGAGPTPTNFTASSDAAIAQLKSELNAAAAPATALNEYQWGYLYTQVTGNPGPAFRVALTATQAQDPRDSSGNMSVDDWWNVVADFVRLGEMLSVTVINGGTGCDDGNCLWIQGSGFTQNMEVVVRD